MMRKTFSAPNLLNTSSSSLPGAMQCQRPARKPQNQFQKPTSHIIKKWGSIERVIKFISIFKYFECLWNPNHCLFDNFTLKENLWTVLASEINCSTLDVKKRINELYYEYVKEKERIGKAITEEEKEPRLDFYNEFSFLDNISPNRDGRYSGFPFDESIDSMFSLNEANSFQCNYGNFNSPVVGNCTIGNGCAIGSNTKSSISSKAPSGSPAYDFYFGTVDNKQFPNAQAPIWNSNASSMYSKSLTFPEFPNGTVPSFETLYGNSLQLPSQYVEAPNTNYKFDTFNAFVDSNKTIESTLNYYGGGNQSSLNAYGFLSQPPKNELAANSCRRNPKNIEPTETNYHINYYSRKSSTSTSEKNSIVSDTQNARNQKLYGHLIGKVSSYPAKHSNSIKNRSSSKMNSVFKTRSIFQGSQKVCGHASGKASNRSPNKLNSQDDVCWPSPSWKKNYELYYNHNNSMNNKINSSNALPWKKSSKEKDQKQICHEFNESCDCIECFIKKITNQLLKLKKPQLEDAKSTIANIVVKLSRQSLDRR